LREAFEGGAGRFDVAGTLCLRRVRALKPEAQDGQRPRVAVGSEVDPGDQPFSGEDGKAIVTIEPLCGWLEDLQNLVKSEELLHTVPIPEQRVERRDEDPRIAPRADTAQARGQVEVVGSNPASTFSLPFERELAG